MQAAVHRYPLLIKEAYLDSFGHVNNAAYLTLFEEARWDLIAKNGFGIDDIRRCGLGPTILQVNVKFQRELLNREEIVIETRLLSYEKKIGQLEQKMLRGDTLCATAIFTIGLFDLKARKLVPPTTEWLRAIGVVIE